MNYLGLWKHWEVLLFPSIIISHRCLGLCNKKVHVHILFETLTLFRTKITLNAYPVLDNALYFKTLFRTKDNI